MTNYWGNWYGSTVGYINGPQGYIPMAIYGPDPAVQYEGGCCCIVKFGAQQEPTAIDNDTSLSPTGYVQAYIDALELVSGLEVKVIGHYPTLQEATAALQPYLP